MFGDGDGSSTIGGIDSLLVPGVGLGAGRGFGRLGEGCSSEEEHVPSNSRARFLLLLLAEDRLPDGEDLCMKGEGGTTDVESVL